MENKKEPTPDKLELWVINKNGQYRIQNQKLEDEISLTFWLPNEGIEKFETTYENLVTILKASNRSLCKPRP